MIANNEYMTMFSKQEVSPGLQRGTFNTKLRSTVLSLHCWQSFGTESWIEVTQELQNKNFLSGMKHKHRGGRSV